MWPFAEGTSGGGKGALVARAERGTALKASGAVREELACSQLEEDVFSNVGECRCSSIAEGKLHELLHPTEYSSTNTCPAHTQCCPPPLNPASRHLFSSNVRCLYGWNFFCIATATAQLPVGRKLFSTHGYFAFSSFAR